MFENMDKLMAQAARQMALEKKKLIAKSKDGLTAAEAYWLLRDKPGFYSLESILAGGSWYATGLQTPIDPNRGIEHIAAYLWDVLEIDYTDNDASGDGLRYVRLRVYEGECKRQLNAAPQAGKADRLQKAGRPSLGPEIEAAYKELRAAGEIDFNGPKKWLYEPIRKKVQEHEDNPNLKKGLGDEALRKIIQPLFEADKNRRSASP